MFSLGVFDHSHQFFFSSPCQISGQSTLGSSFLFWANRLIFQGWCRYAFGSGVTVPRGFGYTLGFRLPYQLDHLFVLVLFWVSTVRRFLFQ